MQIRGSFAGFKESQCGELQGLCADSQVFSCRGRVVRAAHREPGGVWVGVVVVDPRDTSVSRGEAEAESGERVDDHVRPVDCGLRVIKQQQRASDCSLAPNSWRIAGLLLCSRVGQPDGQVVGQDEGAVRAGGHRRERGQRRDRPGGGQRDRRLCVVPPAPGTQCQIARRQLCQHGIDLPPELIGSSGQVTTPAHPS